MVKNKEINASKTEDLSLSSGGLNTQLKIWLSNV